MIINSLLPPVSFQSVIDNQWYIATTDSKLGWVKVDRKYEWEELKDDEIPSIYFKVIGYNITHKKKDEDKEKEIEANP